MVLNNIRRYYSEMFLAEKKVADFILNRPHDVIKMNISELAAASDTSDATIIRVCKHIGYSGYYQMKLSLATEFGQQQVIDVNHIKTPPKDIVELFNTYSAEIFQAAKNINMETMLKCTDLLAKANTVYFVAWGNTSAITIDFANRLSRCGIKTFTSDMPEYLIRNIYFGSEEDVLVGVSHSGTSIHVIQILELAKEKNMKTILITNTKESKAAEIADYVLSAEVKDQLFYDFGSASHVFEMLIVDALLYFLLSKDKAYTKLADQAEIISSQYKL